MEGLKGSQNKQKQRDWHYNKGLSKRLSKGLGSVLAFLACLACLIWLTLGSATATLALALPLSPPLPTALPVGGPIAIVPVFLPVSLAVSSPIDPATALKTRNSTQNSPQEPESPQPQPIYPTTQPAAPAFLPAQVPAVLTFLNQPNATVPPPLQTKLQSLLSPFTPDYHREISPWLGSEITVAVTTFDRDQKSHNGQQPGYFVALEVADPEGAAQFLDNFWQRQQDQGRPGVTQKVQGITITSSVAQPEQPTTAIATALIAPYFVLFSNHPSILAEAVQTLQTPHRSLLHSAPYQAALANLNTPSATPAPQVDRSRALAILNLAALFPPLPTPHTLALDLQPQANTLTLTVALSPSLLPPQPPIVPPENPENSTSSAPEASPAQPLTLFLPPNPALSFFSRNLRETGYQLHHSFRRLGLTPPTPDNSPDPSSALWPPIEAVFGPSLQQILAQTLNQTLQPCLNSVAIQQILGNFQENLGAEAALSLFPAEDGTFQGLAILDRRGSQGAERITALDRAVQDQGFDVDRVTLGDRSVTAWTQLATESSSPSPNPQQPTPAIRLNLQVAGVHTTVPPYEVFATSLETLARSLQSWNQSPTPELSPISAQTTLYLHWPSLSPVFKQQFPILQLLEWSVAPLFSNLESITLTAAPPALATTNLATNDNNSARPAPLATDRGQLTLRWHP